MSLPAALILALLAAAPPPAPPPDEFYSRLNCPWMPLYFRDEQTELTQVEKNVVTGMNFAWFTRQPEVREVRIVLRVREVRQPGRLALAAERAANVRAFLISRGVDPSRILISYEGALPPDGETWVGTRIDPEFYLTSRTTSRLLPNGNVC